MCMVVGYGSEENVVTKREGKGIEQRTQDCSYMRIALSFVHCLYFLRDCSR
jgi:hypothetical protein